MDLYGIKGTHYRIESKPSIGSGGEGGVYAVDGHPDIVIKIYNSDVADAELEEKLKIMVAKPPSSTILNQVAWPLDLVYDERKVFCGFVMPKLSIDSELEDIYKYPPVTNITLKQKLIIAYNVCAVISEVHKAGYIFGDFNPRNIAVNSANGKVAFLDTDGYHIVVDKTKNKAYRARVCKPGYAAPELLEKCAKHISLHPEDSKEAYAKTPLDTFTQETDNFALAIHIFKLLFNGYTPFNGIKESDSASTASPGIDDQAVRRDSYCFKPGMKPQSEAVPPLESVPEEISGLFTRAFIVGRKNPKDRPKPEDWMSALLKYENSLKKCGSNPAHMYLKTLNTCPWCEADKRFKNAISRPIQSGANSGQRSYRSPIIPKNPTPPTTGATSQTSNPPQPSSKIDIKTIGMIAAVIMIFAGLVFGPSVSNNLIDKKYTREPVEEMIQEKNTKVIDLIDMEEVNVKPAEVESFEGHKGTTTFKYTQKYAGTCMLDIDDSSEKNDFYPYVTLYDANWNKIDGKKFGWMDTEGAWVMDGIKPKSTYYFDIESYGAYKFFVHKSKPSLKLKGSSIINDSVDYYHQKNNYKFEAPVSGTYRFELSNMDYSITLAVADGDDNIIATKDCDNGEGITIENVEKGKILKIYNLDSVLETAYTLSVYMPKEEVDISGYDAVWDAVEYSGQNNRYNFQATESGDLKVLIRDLYEDTTVDVQLLDSKGNVIAQNTCKDGGTIDALGIEEGKDYTLVVREKNGISSYYIIFNPDN